MDNFEEIIYINEPIMDTDEYIDDTAEPEDVIYTPIKTQIKASMMPVD